MLFSYNELKYAFAHKSPNEVRQEAERMRNAAEKAGADGYQAVRDDYTEMAQELDTFAFELDRELSREMVG